MDTELNTGAIVSRRYTAGVHSYAREPTTAVEEYEAQSVVGKFLLVQAPASRKWQVQVAAAPRGRRRHYGIGELGVGELMIPVEIEAADLCVAGTTAKVLPSCDTWQDQAGGQNGSRGNYPLDDVRGHIDALMIAR